MKQRLQTLLATEKLASSKFADIVGVNRSSISHLLSGRNNPSLEFLQKVLVKFPHINPDWLLLGQGAMYRNSTNNNSIPVPDPTLFEEKKPEKEVTKEEIKPIKQQKNNNTEQAKEPEERAPYLSQKEPKVISPLNSRKQLDHIVFFYNDGTFDTYRPNKGE
ncbi:MULTISPECIES: helix-turn-helix domain-containing protein [unclassified Saccharicrinis]|uniref:helix-turn-helix domain-containing protein n=1 Tax=unclassified Saccharicrinis TaxID=2646859 RepID=UPI003D32F5CD